MPSSDIRPLADIKEILTRLSLEAFGDEGLLSYEHFRDRDFGEISISEKEYEITENDNEVLRTVSRVLKEVVDQLAVAEDSIDRVGPEESFERNSVAAKITYKRALYMVRLDKFCEAAKAAAFAMDYITDAAPQLKLEPQKIIEPAVVMAVGLLEETFTAYMNPNRYVESDCPSSCGYCQDPVSTVAQYCTQYLESLGAGDITIKQIWETAAAMLGGYLKSKGGDLLKMSFPEHISRKAVTAYKLILYHGKADKEMVLAAVEHYARKLRACELDFFISQYSEETPVIPHDF